MNAEDVVREYWRLMATNDFAAVAAVLAEDFVLEWPQSNERIRGAANLVRMNAEYPSHGPWRFEVHRIVASQTTAVSDVGVTDGVQTGRAFCGWEIRARPTGCEATPENAAAGGGDSSGGRWCSSTNLDTVYSYSIEVDRANCQARAVYCASLLISRYRNSRPSYSCCTPMCSFSPWMPVSTGSTNRPDTPYIGMPASR